MSPEEVDRVLEELNSIFDKIREKKSYKVAGVPSASLKVKCSKCGNEIEFANVIYDTKTKEMICFRCYTQEDVKFDEFKDWMNKFEEFSYF